MRDAVGLSRRSVARGLITPSKACLPRGPVRRAAHPALSEITTVEPVHRAAETLDGEHPRAGGQVRHGLYQPANVGIVAIEGENPGLVRVQVLERLGLLGAADFARARPRAGLGAQREKAVQLGQLGQELVLEPITFAHWITRGSRGCPARW